MKLLSLVSIPIIIVDLLKLLLTCGDKAFYHVESCKPNTAKQNINGNVRMRFPKTSTLTIRHVHNCVLHILVLYKENS